MLKVMEILDKNLIFRFRYICYEWEAEV